LVPWPRLSIAVAMKKHQIFVLLIITICLIFSNQFIHFLCISFPRFRRTVQVIYMLIRLQSFHFVSQLGYFIVDSPSPLNPNIAVTCETSSTLCPWAMKYIWMISFSLSSYSVFDRTNIQLFRYSCQVFLKIIINSLSTVSPPNFPPLFVFYTQVCTSYQQGFPQVIHRVINILSLIPLRKPPDRR
jgi:hypothetical protein